MDNVREEDKPFVEEVGRRVKLIVALTQTKFPYEIQCVKRHVDELIEKLDEFVRSAILTRRKTNRFGGTLPYHSMSWIEPVWIMYSCYMNAYETAMETSDINRFMINMGLELTTFIDDYDL